MVESPTTLPARLQGGHRETVTADRIRPGDWLDTLDGFLNVADVRLGADHVELFTHSSWWRCLRTTRLKRVVQSHRIEMRPDLKPQGDPR